jgi:hypothetical protein
MVTPCKRAAGRVPFIVVRARFRGPRHWQYRGNSNADRRVERRAATSARKSSAGYGKQFRSRIIRDVALVGVVDRSAHHQVAKAVSLYLDGLLFFDPVPLSGC